MVKYFLTFIGIVLMLTGQAASILIPMDESQKNHLKAYGVAFSILLKDAPVDWLLNYHGGSFLVPYSPSFNTECLVRGVTFEVISDVQVNSILKQIESPAVNMNIVRLERAPRVAVYSPKSELLADETDAVINVLTFAEIPFDIIYDDEVLTGQLAKYDWLHLHHEDFTGQFGRFLRREESRIESEIQKITAERHGFKKVSEMKLAVAKRIKEFCAGGGYLFAMCSGAETFDIALSADGVDISESIYDGDDPDPEAQQKLDFHKTLAFENFTLESGYSRKFSDINTGWGDFWGEHDNVFILLNFSAKWDIIPAILTQNHSNTIREFIGQTTAFSKHVIKPTSLIMGENTNQRTIRYIYGESGRGHWTFYGGHDPEGFPGRWREPTDLNQHPNSPGYRLILNNVLFPSAKRKKQKT